MKKILKKFKLKHFALFALVMVITCHLMIFLCSAVLSVNVQSGGESDDGYSVTFVYNEQQGDNTTIEFAYGDDLTIPFHNANVNNADYICDSGTLIPLYDGLSEITEVNLPDGYYNVFLSCISDVDLVNGYDNYALLSSFDLLKTIAEDDGLIEQIYYSEVIPQDVEVYFIRDLQGEGDYSTDTIIVSSLIVPASTPPPSQECITNVWTGVMTFLITSMSTVTNVFWDGSSLTLLGTLCLIGVTIAIIILVFLCVKDFLKLR